MLFFIITIIIAVTIIVSIVVVIIIVVHTLQNIIPVDGVREKSRAVYYRAVSTLQFKG